MDNDKAFTIYALTLTAAVASVITASVMAGFATLPSPLTFVEHLSLSLGFRAAYKSIGGFDPSDWSFGNGKVREAVEAPDTGMAAGATT